MDVVVVTSASNSSRDIVSYSPEHLRETITVASSGQDDRPSESFTNFGWLIDVAAPGGGPSVGDDIFIPRRNILSLRSSASTFPPFFDVAGEYSPEGLEKAFEAARTVRRSLTQKKDGGRS